MKPQDFKNIPRVEIDLNSLSFRDQLNMLSGSGYMGDMLYGLINFAKIWTLLAIGYIIFNLVS